MPTPALVKPAHKAIQAYYQTLQAYGAHAVAHESALRSAFQNLLAETAKAHRWLLVPEQGTRVGGKRVVPDGTLCDEFHLHRGYWEAKDTDDHLDAEISKKAAQGYPLTNTIFEDTRQAVLFQGKREVLRVDLADAQKLADLLNLFYAYTEPAHEDFETAVAEFQDRVPDLARGLADKIKAGYSVKPATRTASSKPRRPSSISCVLANLTQNCEYLPDTFLAHFAFPLKSSSTHSIIYTSSHGLHSCAFSLEGRRRAFSDETCRGGEWSQVRQKPRRKQAFRGRSCRARLVPFRSLVPPSLSPPIPRPFRDRLLPPSAGSLLRDRHDTGGMQETRYRERGGRGQPNGPFCESSEGRLDAGTERSHGACIRSGYCCRSKTTRARG